MGGEAVVYKLVRGGVAAIGLAALLGTVSSQFVFPGLYYDHLPETPSVRDRLPQIATGFGVGGLLLLPHRLTLQGWIFWPRLALLAAVGLFLVWAGMLVIWDTMKESGKLEIFPVGLGLILAGVSLPGSLWWRKRRTSLMPTIK